MLIQAIAIGLVLGFFFFEWTGLVGGGLVAPGYFALSFERPGMIALCLGVAILTMLFIRTLSRVCILYGRRRFILCILAGFMLQWMLGAAVLGSDISHGRLDAVGFIIPGLVANEMDRQGVGATLASLLVLSAGVRLILELLKMLSV